MRDLRNPLAPSIFKGEGRKKRQAKRTSKIATNKAKMEANKNKTNTTGKTPAKGGKVKSTSTSSPSAIKNRLEFTVIKNDAFNKQNQKDKDKSAKRSAKDLELCEDGKCTAGRQKRREKQGGRKAKQKAKEGQNTLKKFGTKKTISKNRLVQTKETKENNRLREQNKRLEKRNKRQAPKIRRQEERQNKRNTKKNTRNPKKKTSEMGPFITQKQRRALKKK
tara:strand:+ start:78 stop:740 length:663 start_codon:yes stop_codon:yes gene_type:complete